MVPKSLMERFRIYNTFFVRKSVMKEAPIEEVNAVFKRNLPCNDYETSQMILNLRGVVDGELLVSQLSFVDDASETVAIAKKEATKKTNTTSDYASNDFADANQTRTITEDIVAIEE